MDYLSEHIEKQPNTQKALVSLLINLDGCTLGTQDIEALSSYMIRCTPNITKHELELYISCLPVWFNIQLPITLAKHRPCL
jgi:hypothetical protein